MRINHVYIFLLVLVAGLFGVTCSPNTTAVEETDELLLVPKEYDGKGKVVNSKKVSPYSCLISTLQNEEEEHNYWNQSFWVKIPKSLLDEEKKGETVLEVFVFGDRDAGQKSRSFGEYDNVVRVAQCEIPDSDKVRERLEKQFRKFGKKSWLDGRQKTNGEQGSGNIKQKSDWEWVCTRYFITIVCSSTSCVISEVRCISWDLEYSGPSGGGGGGGFPSDDPGECDPSGTEPCFDNGGGSVPPPPSPDPCDDQNPPVWCTCGTIADPNLNDIGIREEVYNLFLGSNSDQGQYDRLEKGGWIIKDPNTGNYKFAKLGNDWISTPFHIKPPSTFIVPENAIAFIHTHPFSIGEALYAKLGISESKYIQFQSIYSQMIPKYEGIASMEDINFIKEVNNQAPSGTEILGYLIDKDGIRKFDKNTVYKNQPNSNRINRNCY